MVLQSNKRAEATKVLQASVAYGQGYEQSRAYKRTETSKPQRGG